MGITTNIDRDEELDQNQEQELVGTVMALAFAVGPEFFGII